MLKQYKSGWFKLNYPLISLVIQEGFEPPTHGLEELNRMSIQQIIHITHIYYIYTNNIYINSINYNLYNSYCNTNYKQSKLYYINTT